MLYKVALYKSEEDYAVSCPMLPGCWSQGTNESEAVENIRMRFETISPPSKNQSRTRPAPMSEK